MRRTATWLAWAMLAQATIALAAPATAPTNSLTLVRAGEWRLPLIAGSVREPAQELAHYLKAMSGAEVKWAEARRGTAGIYVGLAADFPWFKLEEASRWGPEEFILRSDGQSLLLLARESPGVSHAVNTFLQALGCRWYFPGQVWEVIPRRTTIAGAWNQYGRPAFPMQRKIWYGFGTYRTCDEDFQAWQRHNRLGGPLAVTIGHTWHGLNPERNFTQHPEWFAWVGGQRQPTKPCYSHPAVLERAIDSARRQAAAGAAMVSMSPPDGLGYCECPRCFAVFQGVTPYAEHGSFFARRPDGVVVNVTSETLFRFVSAVAQALARDYPRTLVGCYAYSAYSHPPSFPLHSNVFLQTTTAFRRTGLTLAEQLDALQHRATHVGIRDYFSVYQWDWDYPAAGKLTPAQLQYDLRFYRDKGVTSLNAEASNNWAARGLGYYLASQLMWDVNADVTALLRDFYEQAFGPAARVMERYYGRWYGPSAAVFMTRPSAQTTTDAPAGAGASTAKDELHHDEAAAKCTLENLQASFRDLEEATQLLREHPAPRARVNQLKLYWHYLYLRHRLDLAAATKNKAAILDAIQAELEFGGRLTSASLIHTRALLGKALLRRFKPFESLLAGVPEVQMEGQGWRRVGQLPSEEELEQLWSDDKRKLGL